MVDWKVILQLEVPMCLVSNVTFPSTVRDSLILKHMRVLAQEKKVKMMQVRL